MCFGYGVFAHFARARRSFLNCDNLVHNAVSGSPVLQITQPCSTACQRLRSTTVRFGLFNTEEKRLFATKPKEATARSFLNDFDGWEGSG
jgi:hypothetical protein